MSATLRLVCVASLVVAACTSSPEPPTPSPPPSPATLDGSGSPLRTPDASRTTADPCTADEDGWEPGSCGRLGNIAIGGERRFEGSAIPIWRVTVWERAGDGWTAALEATGPPDTWADVGVVEVSIGRGALVVGYRYGGTGSVLDYDIVVGGPAVAVHRGGLEQASLVIGDDVIEEYAADFSGGEPACCPERFVRTTIRFSDGAFVATDAGTVTPDERPGSDL